MPAAKLRVKQARWVVGIAEVLAKALQLKNNPLAQFPTELPLNGPTGPSAAKVWLEQARSV